MRRSWMSFVLGCGLVTAAATGVADEASPLAAGARQRSVVAVYGDSPYGTSPDDHAELDATPAFIDSINADPDVGLVLHVGDIHSGKQYCTEAYDRAIFDLWSRFADPLVYTPGDNEWTDCHKKAEGGGVWNATTGAIDYVLDADGNPVDYAGGDPIANLALVRDIFFPRTGVTLGRHSRRVLSQAEVPAFGHPSDRRFVENVLWVQSRVLFVAINLPGGSNNDTDAWYGAPVSAAQTAESADRTGADVRWLELAFAVARAGGLDGVVIEAQADMWDPEKGAAHQAAYEPIVSAIAAATTAFGKPVLMLNGDSHVYQSGNPLSSSNSLAYLHPGYDVPSFYRIVVHGSTFPLEWLKLTIDPSRDAAPSDGAFGPFSWERVVPSPTP